MLPAVDQIDRARAREYALLATLLSRSPDARLIGKLALLMGDATPLGRAHALLGKAAGRSSEQSAAREYFDLFVGLGRGELLPYASHYLTGSLYGRPLASLRETFGGLGIERTAPPEPEDHVSILCEIMAGLIAGEIAAQPGADREFFETHLATRKIGSILCLRGPARANLHGHRKRRLRSLGLRRADTLGLRNWSKQEKYNARIHRRLPCLRRHCRRGCRRSRPLPAGTSVGGICGAQRTNLRSPAVSAEPSRHRRDKLRSNIGDS
jgi:TorA maturation chaperone TorD